MKKYLRTLHKRSDAHKKRFALLVSAGITLIIFAIWSFVTFNNPTPVADNSQDNSLAAVSDAVPADIVPTTDVNAVTPFQDLLSAVSSSFNDFKQSIEGVGQSVGSINLNQDYQNVRNDALPANTANGN